MARRNRVSPTGDLFETSHRGTLFGNRGVLHNPNGAIVRRAQVRRWITCELQFRGRRRPIMAPGRYTELFFLDEAVALAAGHRPCAECRRADYLRYRALWPSTEEPKSADAMDRVLDAERALVDGQRRTTSMTNPPHGSFITVDHEHWLVAHNQLHLWTPAGYSETRPLPDSPVAVLTPPTTVAILTAGYTPRLNLP
ncbi:hypothetical protein [Actinokineospora globicatena]|uniref:hypothetical protein n=1 Tax=Actinokineospora globicatena TaxID=103729 RepID=UPI0020A3353C|nr:hypothetical protein [Actinokineospora globicatena]MCP2302354.1 hypothetical protein [Actinokineospora globicatena]GLW75974.1 hypothetical protein Aglo01_04560 [Actinokineospora globicatena]GLW82813.1 hypothetical protein Aglo02_04530 [Actinokineospora globicatena]